MKILPLRQRKVRKSSVLARFGNICTGEVFAGILLTGGVAELGE